MSGLQLLANGNGNQHCEAYSSYILLYTVYYYSGEHGNFYSCDKNATVTLSSTLMYDILGIAIESSI